MSREPFTLDLSTLSTVGLGKVAADLEAAQLKAARRNRAAGEPIRDDVVTFFEWIGRLVYAEAAERDRLVHEAGHGGGR